ncbi:nitronate monooxygenase [Phenylobacterium sp.]|uniref:NAD(P)H-dependent flavin oxidoreductase n=1 Tax=Phenylobacterium sp. TaxID=1871053 RepID=UPI002DF72789|nr:nitronate monooxygenase [Phenylobacterium sp.]
MSLADLLKTLPIPIVQAPMAGASSPEMALAVSRAGGLGSVAAAAFPPDEIGRAAALMRSGTDAPFGINLLVSTATQPDAAELDRALERLRPFYEALGAPVPERPNRFAHDFDGQFEAVVRAAPPVASFAFDMISGERIAALQAAGSYVIGTANTVAEARAWAEAGADGICAQGAEAGGHRGNFLADLDDSLVGTMALTATVIAAVDLPVIAAGGIMDGKGVAAVLALGAAAAQMGSAFLMADEAITGPLWQQAIAAAPDDPTRLTRAFSGRYARGLENRFMREMRPFEREVPPYPVQNRLTQPLRAAAAAAGDPEMVSLWAGQAVKLAGPGDAETLVRRWWSEAREAARSLAQRTGAT